MDVLYQRKRGSTPWLRGVDNPLAPRPPFRTQRRHPIARALSGGLVGGARAGSARAPPRRSATAQGLPTSPRYVS